MSTHERHKSRLGGIAISTDWKDTSYESILVMQLADSLSERIYQGISRQDLHWKSTSYDPILAYKNGTFQAGANDRCIRACGGLYRPYSPKWPITASSTRLYFETESSPLSSDSSGTLPSSTAVTTYASSTRTLNRNLMTACRKNLQR